MFSGSALDTKINALYKKYNVKNGERSALVSQESILAEKLKELDLEVYEKSTVVLKKMSDSRRESLRLSLQELGTIALQYTLGPEYEMIIDIPENRAKPQAEVYIFDKSKDVKTLPDAESGGGITDILGAAMRTIVLQSLSNPVVDGPIIFDEPFKMVSSEYVPKITEFFRKISEEFGRQIIFVTHNNYIAESCDQIISVDLKDGISEVRYEKGDPAQNS